MYLIDSVSQTLWIAGQGWERNSDQTTRIDFFTNQECALCFEVVRVP